jgi:hypothetical protein
VAFALAGCGEEETSSGRAELADLAPPDAPVYAEVVLRPEGEQRDELEAALGALLGTEDPGGMILGELEQESAEDGTPTDYSEDVLPWLGERASIFASGFGGEAEEIYASVVETTDPEAAAEANRVMVEEDGDSFEQKSYDGVEYLLEDSDGFPASGIVDGHLVGGSELGFQAVVDASGGESLADSTELPGEFDQLGSDAMAAFYADPAAVLDALEASGQLPAEQREAIEAQAGVGLDEPVAGALGATASSFFFESSGAVGDSTIEAAPELLAGLPADSWLAGAVGEVGAELDAAVAGFDAQLEASPVVPPELSGGLEAAAARELGLDLDELTGWIGDVAFYFRGASIFGLGGALIIETSDEQATLEALEPVREAIDREPSLETEPLEIEGEGFEVVIAEVPIQIPVVVRDDRLTVGLGTDSVEEALEPDEPLTDSDAFSAAAAELGEDVEPTFFFDFEPLVELVESTGQAEGDPDYEQAKPYLDALDHLLFGQAVEDDRLRFRISLGVDEAD